MSARVALLLARSAGVRKTILGTPVLRDLAGRFIGGDDLASTVECVRALNGKGVKATLNFYGMHTMDRERAVEATDETIGALAAIQREKLDANVSVKLTNIGLDIDHALCAEQLDRILFFAQDIGGFVRIDVEEHRCLDDTHRLFESAFSRFGPDVVGIVVQSYLRERSADLDRLTSLGVSIRLVKGGCREAKEVAFHGKSDIDDAFRRDIVRLLETGFRPAIATHDEAALAWAKACQQRLDRPLGTVEYQMLHGVKPQLQESLARSGHPVRAYVPFGSCWPLHVLSNLRHMLSPSPGQPAGRSS